MARLLSRSRRGEVVQIHYSPSRHTPRAVFIVEARSRREIKQLRELFDMVGQLAEVVPISHGTLMSYAVRTPAAVSLFSKLEWLLQTQFSFSLVERSLSAVTFQVVESLCRDSGSELADLPECGVCGTVEPFPARATVQLRGREELLHLSYCSACAAPGEAPQEVRNLVGRDRLAIRVPREAEVVLMPEMVEQRAAWDEGDMAVAI